MKRAIGSAAAVIIVIVIIAVAGAGTYYAMNLPKQATPTTTPASTVSTTNSTSTITTTNSTVTTNSTSTRNATTTSLTSTTTRFNASSLPNTGLLLIGLFGNFSAMTLTDNVSQSNSSEYVVLSYNVTGRTSLPNGSYDYQVNFTSQSYLQGKSSTNSSALLYYASNGTVSAVYMKNHNYTGIFALSFSLQYDVLLTALASFAGNSTSLNNTTLSDFQVGATVNETIGTVVMNVTTYKVAIPSNLTTTSTTKGGTTASANSSSIIMKIGRIESNGKVVTSLVVYENYGGEIILNITSLTRAHYS